MTRLLATAIGQKLVRQVSVHVAHTAVEAEQLIRSEAPCVLLTDLDLGDVNGFHLLRWTRQFDPRITIVVLTGHGTLEAEKNAFRMGAADFFVKPVDLQMLVDTVSHFVGRHLTRSMTAASFE